MTSKEEIGHDPFHKGIAPRGSDALQYTETFLKRRKTPPEGETGATPTVASSSNTRESRLSTSDLTLDCGAAERVP